MFENINTVNF